MVAPLTPQMLIDAISVPGVKPVGTTNPDLYNPRYGENTAGQHSDRQTPGAVKIKDSTGRYISGVLPWVELSSMDRTFRNAKVDLIAKVYSLSKSTGKWTERTPWGVGAGGWTCHAFSWGKEHGTFGGAPGPYGWGSVDQNGIHFGDDDGDPQVPAGQAFVRGHGWSLDKWTGANGFFWLGTDLNNAQTPADLTKVNDLAGLVSLTEVVITGADAASARYAISQGWDTQYAGASTTNLGIGTREGTASGFREVKHGSLVVCSTLSRAQIAAFPLTAYPGWNGGTVTPPPPPPPPPATDVKHSVSVRTTTEIVVDGVVASRTVTNTNPVSV